MVAQALLLLASITVGSGDSQLLCFGAPWCEPCREMEPTLDQLVRQGYPIQKINVDDQSALARRYRVEAVPSFVLVDAQGEVVDRIDQATSGENLSKMLAHYRVVPKSITVRGQSSPVVQRAFEPVQSDPDLQAPKTISTLATSGNVTEDAKLASVRLKVEDEEGHSFGTGTVIDVHGDEALVLTCGHIFRTSKGKGRILMDRFDAPAAEPTSGSLISYDIDLDVALVSMKVTRPIQIAKLAPSDYRAQPGEAVFSVGCSTGEPPSIMSGEINQIDKYLGPPNITASGRPVQGRSGGGLFNTAGHLVGVCSAADPEIDEGLYGALPRVYYELDRNGLSFVYEREKGNDNTKSEITSGLAMSASPIPAAERPLAPPSRPNPIRQATTKGTVAVAHASHQTVSASLHPSAEDELVCVLKGDGQETSKIFVIPNPSKILLEYLEREAKKPN